MTVIINESDTVLVVAQPQNSLIVGSGIQGIAGINANATGITGFTNANGFTGNVSSNNLTLVLQNANATQSGQLIPVDWTSFNGAVGNVTILQGNVGSHIGNYTNPHNVTKSQVGLSNVTDVAPLELPVSNATQTALNGKQDTLVSGSNIKTINSISLLGSGDIVITGGNSTGIAGFTNGNGFTGSIVDNNLSLVLQNVNSTQSGQVTAGKYTDWESKGTSNLTIGNTSTTALRGNATTADVSASTNKNYVTDVNLAVINQTSGTNTGDQDLSGLVLKTTTINGVNLSANITLTTANVSASTNKNYVTDAALAVLNVTSGTNTGDQNLSGYVQTSRTVNGQNLTANITTTHSSNSGLGWTSSGHTGSNTVLAGFNATGVAAEYSLSGNGTTILSNNSAALGTPASGNLTNCNGIAPSLTAGNVTNIPNLSGVITGNSTGYTSLTANGTTSAQLAASLTDETGTGSNVFNTNCTLVTPILGTPQSGNLTNCSGTAANLTAGAVSAINVSGTVTGTLPVANGGTGVTACTIVGQFVSTETGTMATGTGTIPLDNTIPQNTEGTEFMTVAITPKSATSKLKIDVVFNGANSVGANNIIAALFQDSTANALACSFVTAPGAAYGCQVKFTHIMTSGTTSSTTFKVRAGGNGASTTTFNGSAGASYFGGSIASSISITEFLP
jgi:hypothetical protein